MAKDSNFTWLTESTSTRSYGGRAYSRLEQGKTYPTADFPAEVVAEWVKSGAAKYAAGKTGKEDSNV